MLITKNYEMYYDLLTNMIIYWDSMSKNFFDIQNTIQRFKRRRAAKNPVFVHFRDIF